VEGYQTVNTIRAGAGRLYNKCI